MVVVRGKKTQSKKCTFFSAIIIPVLVISLALAGCFSLKGGSTALTPEVLDEIIVSSSSSSPDGEVAPLRSSTGQSPLLKSDFLEIIYSKDGGAYGAANLWYDIMMKGKQIMEENPAGEHLRAFEVGAHSAKQSLIAANAGFHAYCVEPSPKSFDRIYSQVADEVTKSNGIAPYIHLFQAAAGSDSNGELDFRTMGGTGDHVGEIINY